MAVRCLRFQRYDKDKDILEKIRGVLRDYSHCKLMYCNAAEIIKSKTKALFSLDQARPVTFISRDTHSFCGGFQAGKKTLIDKNGDMWRVGGRSMGPGAKQVISGVEGAKKLVALPQLMGTSDSESALP